MTMRRRRHQEMISGPLGYSGRGVTSSHVNASTTLPGNISPPEPTFLQASRSHRLCTFLDADLILARHRHRKWLFLQIAHRAFWYRWTCKAADLRAPPSEEVFQCELDQTRGNRGLGDHTEVCRPQRSAWIAELGMVEGVVEFDAERQFGVFPEASHHGSLSQRKIGIKLRRPIEETLAGVAVPGGAVGSDRGRSAQGRRIDPAAESRFHAAGCGQGGGRRTRAERNG